MNNGLTNDLYSLVRKNSMYIALERSIVPIVNFLITVYIIRTLTIDDYGIYNILLAITGYVGLASSLGLTSAFQRFLPEFYQKREIAKIRSLVDKGLLLRFMLCMGILIVVILFSKQIGSLFQFERASEYLVVFSFAIVFHLESGLLSGALTSVFHHKSYVISQIAYVFGRAGVLYYFLATGRGLIGLLIGESISFGFLCVILFVYYRQFLSHYGVRDSDVFPTKRLVRYSGFSYFNEVGSQILAVTTDYFVISAFLGPVAVGIYAFANRVMTQLSHVMPHSLLIDVIRPAFFTKYVQSNDSAELTAMFNLLSKLIAFFVFPLLVGIIILGDKLITLVYSVKYLESHKILWIVAAFSALNFFMLPIGLVLQALEKVQVLLYSKVFAIYNLIVDILVVSSYGIIGVAVVTGSAVLFKNIYCYFSARKYVPLRIDLKCLALISVNSLLMGLVLLATRGLISTLPAFILFVVLGIFCYLMLSYFNKVFTVEERKVLNSILPKPYFVF